MTNAQLEALLGAAMSPYLTAFLEAPEAARLTVTVTSKRADAVFAMSQGDFTRLTVVQRAGFEDAFRLLCGSVAAGRTPTLQPAAAGAARLSSAKRRARGGGRAPAGRAKKR